jgi:hypothetical protein
MTGIDFTTVFDGIALGLSCLLLAVLCKTRRNPQRAVVWAAPMLMIGLVLSHLTYFSAYGLIGFLAVSFWSVIVFVIWAYAYLGSHSFWAERNAGLAIAVVFSIILMPWFFLYLAIKIYNDYRGRGAEHVKRVWEEALGR